VLLVLMLGQSRVFFAVSRDGLLPPAFSKIHPKYRTPYLPTTLTGIAVGLAAAFLPIDELGEMTSIGTLFAFVLVCIGVWILRRSEPQLKRPFRTPLVPAVPILGAFFCLYLMASLREATWIRLVVWLAIGLVIYFSYGRFHSKVQHNMIDKAAASGR
jgi:basic amino acid/polyamine antiporter, APA family